MKQQVPIKEKFQLLLYLKLQHDTKHHNYTSIVMQTTAKE
jgi:hypothetical protein